MTDARAAILCAFNAALDAVDPERAMSVAASNAMLSGRPARVDIVAIGKAAVPMVRGAVSALNGTPYRVFIITKDGHDLGPIDPAWTVRFSSHPVLDERSLAATTELLTWLESGDRDRPTWCLISGGGSALLELPVEDVSLAEFQHLTRSLLAAGADIYQLNTVRSRLSQVKGGGLRNHIRGRSCTSFLLSDVLGNDPAIIASGPTVQSDRTADDAIAVLEQFRLTHSLPAHMMDKIGADRSVEAAPANDDHVSIVADNAKAVGAASDELCALGLRPVIAWRDQTGEAAVRASDWIDLTANLADHVDAILGGGELTVTVGGNGIGGRNTEFAFAAALALHERGISGWTIASLATDGQDSLTGMAGAIVDTTTIPALITAGYDPSSDLANNNTSPPLEAIGATVVTGPTGTNVNDLYLAVRTHPA